VELVAEGAKAHLEELVAWCHRGPTLARVDEVEVVWEEPQDAYKEFFIAQTV
jgi:acylphosphatase